MAGEFPRGLLRRQHGRVGHDLRRAAAPARSRSPPSRFLTAAVAMVVRGHSALTAIPSRRNSSAMPEHAHAHAVLGHACRPTCGGEPLARFMSSGGDSMRMCGLAAFSRCGMAGLGHQEGAARVDAVHQVVALQSVSSVPVRLMALALLTQDVDAAERRRRSASTAAVDLLLVAHVDDAAAAPCRPPASISSAAV